MKIRWTRIALADLDSISARIATDGQDVAQHVIARIEDAVGILVRHPEAGRAGRISGTRELVVVGTPFIAAYRIRRDAIEVLAIIHGARNWPKSL